MKRPLLTTIVYVISALYFVLLGYWLCHRTEVHEHEYDTIYSDTITIEKYDTIMYMHPIADYVEVVDTISVVVNDTQRITLPKSVSVYKDSLYSAYISGYECQLDSISIVDRLVEVWHNTIVSENVNKVYINGILGYYNRSLGAGLGIHIADENKLVYGAFLGVLKDKPFFGASIGYNIVKF